MSQPVSSGEDLGERKILLLETSARRGLAGVALGERLLASRSMDEARRNARDLAPFVRELLGAQGWAAKQLDAVFVGRGPGSYTGLRVGIMSAKVLAYATGAVVLGLETFAVMARQAPAECNHLDVLADAQKDNIYLQSFARRGEEWSALGELAILPFPDWLAGRDPAAWVSGPGLAKYDARLPADVRRVAPELREPGLSALLVLGLERLRRGERDDPFALEPLYLRPSSAEEQWRDRRPGGS